MGHRSSCCLALLALLLLAAAGAEARIYRWVDESGAHHFTDRAEEVPQRFRDQLALEEDPEPEGNARFVVVPGIGGTREEGEPIQPIDEVAYEAEALAALESLQGDQRGALVEMLAQGATQMLPYLIAGMVVAFLIVSAFGAVLLMVSCRICGAERPGFGKGVGIVFLQLVAVMALGVIVALIAGPASESTQVQAGNFGLSFVLQAGVLRGLHLEGMGRALIVTAVMTLLSLAVGLLFVLAAVCAGLGVGLTG